MPENENVTEKKTSETSEDKTVKEVSGMDKDEGQTDNGTVGGTGSDLENTEMGKHDELNH